MKKIYILLIVILAAVFVSYFYLPINRVGISSELIMLGDLNNDRHWDQKDQEKLEEIKANPFSFDGLTLLKLDINRNDLIDREDLAFLNFVYQYSDPYVSEQKAGEEGLFYPRPREFFKYLPTYEYIQAPIYTLEHPMAHSSPFSFFNDFDVEIEAPPYQKQLLREVYQEALRFSFAYTKRENGLTDIERDYAQKKIQYCEQLFTESKFSPLLLNLIGLVEDAETLTIKDQSDFIKKLLYFRDHLQMLLVSEDYASFEQGNLAYLAIYKKMENLLKEDLNISLDFQALEPPRDFSDLKNYLDRAEWQAFKSKTKKEAFKQLVLYAQYDRRYLRSVSRTSPRFQDVQLRNHNLSMILLFREALKISQNNKKAAVALLDEAIRIPMGWVKGIPKDKLPSSVALENFLLPGNMEDGPDKSRHWNVFGGIAIYKSPQDSLVLALKRENMDLKDQNYTPDAMREFIRDTIANINGIYYVVSIQPDLLKRNSEL